MDAGKSSPSAGGSGSKSLGKSSSGNKEAGLKASGQASGLSKSGKTDDKGSDTKTISSENLTDGVNLSKETKTQDADIGGLAASLADSFGFSEELTEVSKTGVDRSRTVEEGTNLTEMAREDLQAAGIQNPTEQLVQNVIEGYADTNSLANRDKIFADSQLQVPEDVRRGAVYNQLSQGVIPGGPGGNGGMPSAGFSSDMQGLVNSENGLSGLIRDMGVEGVEKGFDRHMATIGRDHISLDLEQYQSGVNDAAGFTVTNSRDHLSFGGVASY